jgi:DnaJ-class molecular chaperone
VFRFKGKGAPKLKGSGSGDLRVKAKVVVPDALTAEQTELLEKYSATQTTDLRSHIV